MRFLECSLERMIGYIIEVNKIRSIEFIVYITRLKKEFMKVGQEWIFTYNENWNRKHWTLKVGEAVNPGWLEMFENWAEKKPEENFGIISQVELFNDETRHIPMVDFRCPCSAQNLRKVVATLGNLGQKKGFIVESGNSYHFYGIPLLTPEEWQDLMVRCKKEEIIGADWPHYQLLDGFSALRLSASTSKPIAPRVIARVGRFKF